VLGIAIILFYFLVAAAFSTYGLLSCFWPEKAYRAARAWNVLIRLQRPDIDWDPYIRRQVPPRVVGFFLFLFGIWMFFFPLAGPVAYVRKHFVGSAQGVAAHGLHPDWLSLFFLLVFVIASAYLLVDPIGLFCFFTRQPRNQYPTKYKRGWAVSVLGISFLTASLVALFYALRGH
jgi:hypothetical protein